MSVEKPEDDVPYDYHITTILLPLWLAWKVFEGLDDPNRAEIYRARYEQMKASLVPVVWKADRDRNMRWIEDCCHEA